MSADGARLYPNHNLKSFNAYDSISVFDVCDNVFLKISWIACTEDRIDDY